ncbi:CatB-related O-acetyltransferase [Pseudarthrobacter sp. SL88]|uniref:CatB-related O-acetyltransferase n=1 Tax=Pseudarthrobacter sp. SL88 TaxID=2994666 RepID=UPI002DD43F7B|nr:CatB-related O-acetyltransferase [Pseudarthrobacter sp. SL88]
MGSRTLEARPRELDPAGQSIKAHAMRRSVLGKLLCRAYTRAPFKNRLLGLVVRLEGGDMYSLSLREILETHHGVTAGKFSYGSLLSIGHADRHTTIGNYVSVGPNVRRFGAAHPLNHAALHPLFYNPALGLVHADGDVDRTSCRIGHDAWIGANVTILPGCKSIGMGSVVGAGSVVTKDVPAFAIVAGNPAKIIAHRFTDDHQADIIKGEFWRLEPSQAARTVSELNSRMRSK